MLRRMSEKSAAVSALKITPEALAGLIGLVDRKTINQATAKELFDEICDRGGDPAALARERGLGQISDSAELEKLVGKAMAENPESVADYRRGKTAAAKFLMGCIMRMSRGRADPREAQRILEERLRIDLPGNAR
jgi:aspartyl-tRNA(Asn)/glutamyl-tRNA(Gln) amidotransferase subunit B